MHITITGEEVAKTIAAGVEQTTGKTCEAFTNETGSVVVCDRNTVIARVTPLFSVIDVAPLCGPFVCDITEVPFDAWNIDDIREIANALDTAISHVTNAALNH